MVYVAQIVGAGKAAKRRQGGSPVEFCQRRQRPRAANRNRANLVDWLLTYNAAHAAALAALRWHGYRSDSRYLVFQCLAHTVQWRPEQWLILDQAHSKRNLFEYEGELNVNEGFIAELIEHTANLIMATEALIALTI